MLKRFFVEAQNCNAILFVDESNRAYVIDESSFNTKLTFDVAKSAHFTIFDNCITAEDCYRCQKCGYTIDYNANDFNKIIEF
jgi:hypothetical protein